MQVLSAPSRRVQLYLNISTEQNVYKSQPNS